jgi:cell division septal protein FtsQ
MYGRSYEELTMRERVIIILALIAIFLLHSLIIMYGWNIIAMHYGLRPIQFIHAVVLKLIIGVAL